MTDNVKNRKFEDQMIDMWGADIEPQLDKLRLLFMLIDNRFHYFSDWDVSPEEHKSFFGALSGILREAIEPLDRLGSAINEAYEARHPTNKVQGEVAQ